jgi:hypothetical protein
MRTPPTICRSQNGDDVQGIRYIALQCIGIHSDAIAFFLVFCASRTVGHRCTGLLKSLTVRRLRSRYLRVGRRQGALTGMLGHHCTPRP